MDVFEGIKFKNSFAKLSNEFYTKQKWSSFEKPHLIAFNKNLAADLEADISQVNVKATTTEKLGFEGRKEGISSHAVVIMSKHNS